MHRHQSDDSNQIYILGIGNGGGFTPSVREADVEQGQVCGYVVVGGWVKTWFEHMLEIERRRFRLMGKSPAEVNERMKGAATLYHDWLISNKTVEEILTERAKLAGLWPEGQDHANPEVLRLLTDWFKEQRAKARHTGSADSSPKLMR